ncbi:MAG: methyl-accepting chemotaxis protein [Desulfarculus sp.]|nr:methyl-accepting chemotaxis protein [Desulfarculus sp.]
MAGLRIGIGGKIMAAVLASLLPLLVVILVLENRARETITLGVEQDQDHIAQQLMVNCQAQQEILQVKLGDDLRVAEYLLNQLSGGWGLNLNKMEAVQWKAVNQVSKETKDLSLPGFMAGPATNLSQDTSLVDKVKALVGGTCTIFQRMNPEGDLLRVSTNVTNKEGARALGTFIPRDSPVAQAVVKGETFHGRAFVVNGWYITAYKPLKDGQDQVIGALYVGVPEQSAKGLLEAIRKVKVGQSGFAFVFNGDGEMIVHPSLAGQKVLEVKDARGQAVYAEMAQALKGAAQDGQVRAVRLDGGQAGRLAIKYTTFSPWQWIIAVAAHEDELYAGVRQMTLWGWGILVAAALVLLPLGWLFARSLSRPLTRAIAALGQEAVAVQDSAAGLSQASQNLAVGSSQQASSLEETSSSLEEMASMTTGTADNAAQADQEMRAAQAKVDKAGQGMEAVAASMTQMAGAGEQISKIIKTIDEIAFQTNLLALNAGQEHPGAHRGDGQEHQPGRPPGGRHQGRVPGGGQVGGQGCQPHFRDFGGQPGAGPGHHPDHPGPDPHGPGGAGQRRPLRGDRRRRQRDGRTGPPPGPGGGGTGQPGRRARPGPPGGPRGTSPRPGGPQEPARSGQARGAGPGQAGGQDPGAGQGRPTPARAGHPPGRRQGLQGFLAASRGGHIRVGPRCGGRRRWRLPLRASRIKDAGGGKPRPYNKML